MIIKASAALRNDYTSISNMAKETREPIYITKNGEGDIVGATIDLGLVWSISDTCNGLMVIPNLIGVFLLSGTALKLIKEYFSRKNE